MRQWVPMFLWLIATGTGNAQDPHNENEGGGLESIVRMAYPELGRMERRLVEIDREMTKLPSVREETWGSRFGHHSGPIASETEPNWVQLDLAQDHLIDRIVLVPVDLSYQGKSGEGHGFPLRFKIEVANNPEMEGAVTVVDCSEADVPNPGKYPRMWKFSPVRGRHVRFTSLKHPRDENGHFWALEEMMVMSGDHNLALDAEKSASSWLDLGPQWSLIRLADGQSALGMPVDVNSPSPSEGYLSASSKGEPTIPKWVSIDLLKPHVIERVRILPLESNDYEVVGGRGFPRSFRIELSNDADFRQLSWREERGNYPLGYPADCALTIRVPSVKARYVRIVATLMWSRDDLFQFGMAEMEVSSEGTNVALGKPVTAYDQADKPVGSRWGPEYLVDGYTSKARVIGWTAYLDALERHRILHNEKKSLTKRCAHILTLGRRIILTTGVVVLFTLMGGWLWATIRGRMLRHREMTLLREQIARDLHDDIGSNLGGIMLLSEVGALHSGSPQCREDFGLIRSAAEEASTSMRDIVWLIESGHTSLRELVAKMRESTLRILGESNVSFEVEPADYEERELSLLFRRHVLLSFKETLHNIRKHAAATDVSISIQLNPKTLVFVAKDNGRGFDRDLTGQTGHGLTNLRRRAERLRGAVRIDSKAGAGTSVTFQAPLDS